MVDSGGRTQSKTGDGLKYIKRHDTPPSSLVINHSIQHFSTVNQHSYQTASQSNNSPQTFKMKFTTVVLGLFVAIAAAAPANQENAQDIAARAAEADPKLEARQSCGQCYGGTRTCCGPGGCIMVKC